MKTICPCCGCGFTVKEVKNIKKSKKGSDVKKTVSKESTPEVPTETVAPIEPDIEPVCVDTALETLE